MTPITLAEAKGGGGGMQPMTDRHRERIVGLRNLRTGYDLVAAVGFWRQLEGEDLIDVYAATVEETAALTAALVVAAREAAGGNEATYERLTAVLRDS